ncbi:MAG: SDR family oxidoreductase [Bacteroidetes bacterium]|nr:SDR family oxidoreductase [Bacteroidota bacterium]
MKNYTLITGGSNGIGRALADIFAKDGYNLILVSRNMENLTLAQQELQQKGVDVKIIQKDLMEPGSARQLYDEVTAQGLHVNILVNDAGQGLYGKFAETEIERELAIIQLNICSLVELTKYFLKDMIARGDGKVLNLSSIASKGPSPWQSVYHGTKAFVQSFTEAIRSELAEEEGITITALLPGVTDTDFFNKADMTNSKAVQDKSEMADPAVVAQDGYDALMAGKDMIVSGFKNKAQVAVSAVTPDSAVAEQTKKKQEPVRKPKK